jgi:GH25 family lysozyme M1 (1,4-beta-N-acetylmuramidase)
MAKYIRGIDVAIYEPNINWERVCAEGIHFAFIKASQADFTDPKFDSHWAGSKPAGILRGAYHFLDPRVDSRVQAQTFLNKVKLEPGDLPPVLDLEELKPKTPPAAQVKGSKGGKNQGAQGSKGSKASSGDTGTVNVPNAQFIACAQDWLQRVEDATGRRPIIYSGPAFLQSRMSSPNGRPPAWAMKYTLWLANYLNHPINEDFDLPWQPNGWSAWKFWQYSDRGNIAGIMADDGSLTGVDLNFFRGTLEELYALAGATMPVGGVDTTSEGHAAPPVVDNENDKKDVGSQPAGGAASAPVDATKTTNSTGSLLYMVKAGDTLFAIALAHHTTVDAIVKANPHITNPNLIFVGETLNIPQA